MINIWDYANENRIKIITVDGKEYDGEIISIDDAEETEEKEDGITIYTGEYYMGFLQSEIKEIKIIE